MLFNNLHLLMVAVFLLLTLVVGLYYSRKTNTLREYAIGNKQFTTATLVATVLASNYAACLLINNVEQVYTKGLYWILFMLLTSGFPFWMISQLAIRMDHFMHNLSMTESIGKVYGKYPRIVAALANISSAIASVALQIQVMALTIKRCIGSNGTEEDYSITITIIATVILIAYSSLGGIRAVTFTDVLQFTTFTVIIPLLTFFIYNKTVDIPIAEILPYLQKHPNFQLNEIFHLDVKLIAMLALVLSALVSYIEPAKMQRVYMSTSAMQAKKVFLYAGFFSVFIDVSILLIGLFTFIGSPTLLQGEAIWGYVIDNIPSTFQGFVFISLIAMDMSTADSDLNTCAVMVSHDIVESIKEIKLPEKHPSPFIRFMAKRTGLLVKKVAAVSPLLLAKVASCMVGICAMFLTFRKRGLLDLLCLMFDFSVPIITAPYVLAIFGFRSTSRTALIGMFTGACSIYIWNQWINPLTDINGSLININGSFFCMIANGLAMLASHYLFPQRKGTGWAAPNKIYQQRQQEKERIARRNRKIRATFFCRENLVKLKPNAIKLVLMGMYIVLNSLTSMYCYGQESSLWKFLPFFVIGVAYIGYVVFLHGTNKKIPDRLIGKYWFLSLLSTLPLHLFVSCYVTKTLLLPLVLFFMHGAVLLWTLPLYWSIRTLLVMVGSMVVVYGYKGCILLWSPVVIPLLGLGLLTLTLVIYFKYQATVQQDQVSYFKYQQKLKESYKLKSLAYALELPTTTPRNQLATEGSILEQAIQNVTQSISFSDEYTTFYKEDFQTIIHKFSEWAIYLKQRAKSQSHALLQPSVMNLEDFIDEVEVSYEKERDMLPSLWVEKIEIAGNIPATIIGDRTQLVQLLVMALTYLSKESSLSRTLITLQLHTTHLQYKKSEPIEDAYPPLMVFPAVALLLTHSQKESNDIPEVKSIYGDDTKDSTKPHNDPILQEKLDLKKQKMERIVRAHYGHMALTTSDAILVIPRDVTQVKEEMLAVSLPRETGTSEESTLTPQEQAESLTKLADFHDWVCSTTAVEPTVISEILLLLRRCYGFKRHPSGQLFYLRTVGIATWVARWVGYHPKLIYAALLYDLVRYTRLPLSYIKANYNLGVLCFVENVLNIDNRSELEASLFAVSNRFKEALEKEQLSVLYIKLAERLYDLEHAAGYSQLESVKSMARESLTIDVKLAQRYVEPEIAATLAKTASKVLNSCVVQN